MQVVSLTGQQTEPIADYGSAGAASVRIAAGRGDAHIHVIVLDPGGVIGPHEAGFGQLLVPLSGSGWIADADGHAVPISRGTAGFVRRGEIHSKGSDTGMTALMIQVRDLPTPGATST